MKRFWLFVILSIFVLITPMYLMVSENLQQQPKQEPVPSQPARPKAEIAAKDPAPNHPKAIIVLDPGHGGDEDGAKGWTTNIKEKDITLEIAKSTKKWLTEQGVKVYLTRISDYQLASELREDLLKRAKFADHPSIQATLFVSIHIDQFNKTIHGTKVYYSGLNPFPEESKQLSLAIHHALTQEIDSKPLDVHENDFLVLKENVIAAALVEVGHLSHLEEEQRLISKEYQKLAGIGIAKGILAYLEQK